MAGRFFGALITRGGYTGYKFLAPLSEKHLKWLTVLLIYKLFPSAPLYFRAFYVLLTEAILKYSSVLFFQILVDSFFATVLSSLSFDLLFFWSLCYFSDTPRFTYKHYKLLSTIILIV